MPLVYTLITVLIQTDVTIFRKHSIRTTPDIGNRELVHKTKPVVAVIYPTYAQLVVNLVKAQNFSFLRVTVPHRPTRVRNVGQVSSVHKELLNAVPVRPTPVVIAQCAMQQNSVCVILVFSRILTQYAEPVLLVNTKVRPATFVIRVPQVNFRRLHNKQVALLAPHAPLENFL